MWKWSHSKLLGVPFEGNAISQPTSQFPVNRAPDIIQCHVTTLTLCVYKYVCMYSCMYVTYKYFLYSLLPDTQLLLPVPLLKTSKIKTYISLSVK